MICDGPCVLGVVKHPKTFLQLTFSRLYHFFFSVVLSERMVRGSVIVHHLVQKILLLCILSKHRVSYYLLDIGIILLPDHVMCLFLFLFLFVSLLVCLLVCVQACECRLCVCMCIYIYIYIYIYILLNICEVSDIRQSELQAPDSLLPETTSCGVEFAISKSKI
jgi:hypothetical protein